jgi:thiamine-phosphate pyrophosphorylase
LLVTLLCLVTDRRRTDPVAQARAAASAGIDLVQIRERDLEAAPLTALVRAVLAAVHGSGTRVVVNDRLDVAVAAGAHGVHLRADSFPVGAARQVGPPGFLVGRSVHSVDEALAASDADYLVAGTVFPTASKPGQPMHLGVEGLGRIAAATRTPVLAIGGVTLDTAAAITRAGAAGIAAIGLFAGPAPLDGVVRTLRSQFDSAKTAP